MVHCREKTLCACGEPLAIFEGLMIAGAVELYGESYNLCCDRRSRRYLEKCAAKVQSLTMRRHRPKKSKLTWSDELSPNLGRGTATCRNGDTMSRTKSMNGVTVSGQGRMEIAQEGWAPDFDESRLEESDTRAQPRRVAGGARFMHAGLW
jgi:hypothetical protein